MKNNITFSFIPIGSIVSPKKGACYLDVGNNLCPGIIDHHHIFSKTCAAKLIVEHKDYLINWLKDYDNPELIVHESPDFDCVSAAYIASKIIKNNLLKEEYSILSEYALQVDQSENLGNVDIDNPSLYIVFEVIKEQIINDLKIKFDDKNNAILKSGFELFDHVCENINGKNTIPVDLFISGKYDYIKDFLKNDLQKFLSDTKDKEKFMEFEAEVPLASSNKLKKIDCVIYKNPSSTLFKLFTRKGLKSQTKPYTLMITIFPKSINGVDPRYVISVDPDLPKESSVNLLGLGYLLNKLEEKKIISLGKDPVTEKGVRFTEYNLTDPWYDGRAHNWTIVDTPRNGTVLEFTEILDAVKVFSKKFPYYQHISTKYLLFYRFNLNSNCKKVCFKNEWNKINVDSQILSKAFLNFLNIEKIDINFFHIRQKDNITLLIFDQKVGILIYENNYDENTSISDLFELNNLINSNSYHNNEIRNILPCSIEADNPELIFKSRLIILKPTNDLNNNEDENIFKKIVYNFAKNNISYYQGLDNFYNRYSDEVKIGKHSRYIINSNGLCLFLNIRDPNIDFATQSYHRETFNNELKYITGNALILLSSLNYLTEKITDSNQVIKKQSKLMNFLSELKDFSINIRTKTLQYNLSNNTSFNEIWKILLARLNINDIKNDITNSLEDLEDYIKSKRTSRIDKLLFILSILIGPFTLLTDYFGNMMASNYKSWPHFFITLGIAYSAASVIAFFIYLFTNKNKKKSKRFLNSSSK